MVSVIHDNKQLPMIEVGGIYLRPGRRHKLGYKKKTTFFLPAPFTKCNVKIPQQWKNCFRTSMVLTTDILPPSVPYSVDKASCNITEKRRIFMFIEIKSILDMNNVVVLIPICGVPVGLWIWQQEKRLPRISAMKTINALWKQWTNCWIHPVFLKLIVQTVLKNAL